MLHCSCQVCIKRCCCPSDIFLGHMLQGGVAYSPATPHKHHADLQAEAAQAEPCVTIAALLLCCAVRAVLCCAVLPVAH